MSRTRTLFAVLSALALAPAQAAAPTSTLIPREKVELSCTDSYFKVPRRDFLLQDETYPTCTLRLPLALRDRWPGQRTFYVIPRVSASLYARDDRGKGAWLPVTPLVNPGSDPLHRAVSSRGYEAIELSGHFGHLGNLAATRKPDTVSTGGKLTVCAAPLYRGEEPCHTFDVAARFKVYSR